MLKPYIQNNKAQVHQSVSNPEVSEARKKKQLR